MVEFNKGDKVKIIKLESKSSNLKDEGEIINAANDEITVKLDSNDQSTKTNIEEINKVPFPCLWWIISVIIVISSIGLTHYYTPDWMGKISPQVPKEKWDLLIAIYLGDIVISTIICYLLVQELISRLLAVKHVHYNDKKPIKGAHFWGPTFLGVCEQILYPTSLIMHHPEFIGIWLALKVAGQWGRWGKDDEGRRIYNKFLIGNALSIIFGILTYAALKAFVLKNQ